MIPSTHDGLAAELAGFSGRRVLVTGHTGFKGTWLSVWLHRLGAEVIGCALDPPSDPSLFTALGLTLAADVRQDILDLDALVRVLDTYRPELVIHMAAQPLVRYSFQYPVSTFATNVMGTVHVLEACRQTASVRAIVSVTSDKCYENREWVWGYRESDPMGGFDPYSASKGCSELAVAAYERSFFHDSDVALASVRAGNVIGGGDWGADRLIPDCIRALAAHKTINIRHPQAIRPWQHVLEPLSGYLRLAYRLLEGDGNGLGRQAYVGGWNFGPHDAGPVSVGECATRVARLWGEGDIVIDKGPHPHEAHYLKLDCSKASSLLGWRARWSVSEALERTVSWYRRFYDGAAPQELMALLLAQIDEYTR